MPVIDFSKGNPINADGTVKQINSMDQPNTFGPVGSWINGAVNGLWGPQATYGQDTSTGSSTPTYSSAVLPLYNHLLSAYQSAATPGSFFNGYQSQGQQSINQTSAAGGTELSRLAATHGMEYSPSTGTAAVQQELARQSQQTGFNNSIPLLQRQDQLSALRDAGTFFNAMPTGKTTTGTVNSTAVGASGVGAGVSALIGMAAGMGK